jgi:hypothetical protein
VDTGVLHKSNIQVFLDFNAFPCALINGEIINLSDSLEEIKPYYLPDTLPAQNIYCCPNGELFTVTQRKLKRLIDNKMESIFDLPGDSFRIMPADTNSIYIVGKMDEEQAYNVYHFQYKDNVYYKLFTHTAPIAAITGNGKFTFIAIDSTVYLLANDETKRVMSCNSPIQSLSLSGDGFFYSTANEVGFINQPDKPIPFIKKGAKTLLSHNDLLYILFDDGMLASINHTDKFSELTQLLDSINK